ncbi:MAG: hypothetical protein QM529_06865, partial [Hydrotalea sp.]|nr:hypothetical protein [Hydrotalea sp.]
MQKQRVFRGRQQYKNGAGRATSDGAGYGAMGGVMSPARTGAIFYLAVPLLVFFLSFVNWWLAVPAALLMLYLFYKLVINTDWQILWRGLKKPTWQTYYLLGLTFLWCYISGYIGHGGGHLGTGQPGDWYKHYAVINFLRDNWSLRGNVVPLGDVTLRYYLGYYLVPTGLLHFFPWVFGWLGARAMLALWTMLGVFLFFNLLREANPDKKTNNRWLVVAPLVFMFFSNLGFFGGLFYHYDVTVVPHHYEAWSWAIGFPEYSSHATLLTWVPQHALSPWLGLGILWPMLFNKLDNKTNAIHVISYLGLLASAMLFWSPFSFLGLAPFMMVVGCRYIFLQPINIKTIKHRLPDILHWQNIAGLLLLALPVLIYLHAGGGGNFLGWSGYIFKIGLFFFSYMVPMIIIIYYYFIDPQGKKDMGKESKITLFAILLIMILMLMKILPELGSEFIR